MGKRQLSKQGLADEPCPGSWQRDVLSRQLHGPHPVPESIRLERDEEIAEVSQKTLYLFQAFTNFYKYQLQAPAIAWYNFKWC
ncbi:hypothetical protein DP119_05245 [Planococcus maitriensis]|uniref:Uncharacterized protein n=1 Tax=Planococcus maitriensis TaxID=221799 RepID=A0A365KCR5_9BACL|nr:hypothetical protein DP119_05245 [Planococcus maitriensis]